MKYCLQNGRERSGEMLVINITLDTFDNLPEERQQNASKTIAVVLPRECCKESTSVDCDYETYGNDSFRASVSFLQSSKSAFIEHENAARNENSRG